MNEFVNFLVNVTAIYLIGKLLATLVERLLIHRILEKMRRQIDNNEFNDVEEEMQNVMLLDVEKVDGQYLCYDSVTGAFVCQGKDIPEIDQRFHARYPGMKALLSKADSDTIVSLGKEPELA
jgi:hypothetical protein|tara:strand:+ start:2721 stop:3086 length:366 start_codon:yes stop_codon:yes gene_type:complete